MGLGGLEASYEDTSVPDSQITDTIFSILTIYLINLNQFSTVSFEFLYMVRLCSPVVEQSVSDGINPVRFPHHPKFSSIKLSEITTFTRK